MTYEVPSCEQEEIHSDAISLARAKMPSVERLYDLADFFKLFSDSTRVRILVALDAGQLCVCDIAELLGMTKSAVSHQLRALRQANLVAYRKSGKNIFYSLKDTHVRDIIEKAIEHLDE